MQDLTNKICWAVICGGGNADLLQEAIGSSASGIRFMNGTSGVSKDYQWHGYGDTATAEYYAEAFRAMIEGNSTVHNSADVTDILQSFIIDEASPLP